MKYEKFLKTKRLINEDSGLAEIPELNSNLFEFQRDIVSWALRRGRAGIFADCGLGKTLIQLAWTDQIPGRVLIVAPLAVSGQTVAGGCISADGVIATYHKNGKAIQRKVTLNKDLCRFVGGITFNAVITIASMHGWSDDIIESFSDAFSTGIGHQAPVRLRDTIRRDNGLHRKKINQDERFLMLVQAFMRFATKSKLSNPFISASAKMPRMEKPKKASAKKSLKRAA